MAWLSSSSTNYWDAPIGNDIKSDLGRLISFHEAEAPSSCLVYLVLQMVLRKT